MSWKCFFLGCKWRYFLSRYERGELLTTQTCKRCGGLWTIAE